MLTDMNSMLIISNVLYFLALINPVSKVFILCTLQPPCSRRELVMLSVRSTVVAFLILLVLTICGDFLLRDVFRVDIYSLKVAGGLVLFLIGLTAVRRGRFFEETLAHTSDISIVPLAAPLIAGPGTMTGAISFASEHGIILTLICITLALAINLVIMLFSARIGEALERVHATGPLIRITGLIVAAVAVQMVLDGLGKWIGVYL
ncbi:MAG: MarC family protein [Verrucomicrobia bacterium]|nr:MarC family protein [Verrucomicrobiota bacterium]MBU1735694.1 MarC family protein [Verrucomicrobiota bacterium]MBU1858083.1 MarC family protein [Verrucomicrobiota bacterium]